MLNTIESVNSVINNFIWGVPAMICIIGVGLYLSFGLRFLQIRKFPYAIRVTIGRIFRKRDASIDVKTMLLLAIATSIDALAVGVTFAFLDVRILQAVSFIGCTTFILSVIGVKVGTVFGVLY